MHTHAHTYTHAHTHTPTQALHLSGNRISEVADLDRITGGSRTAPLPFPSKGCHPDLAATLAQRARGLKSVRGALRMCAWRACPLEAAPAHTARQAPTAPWPLTRSTPSSTCAHPVRTALNGLAEVALLSNPVTRKPAYRATLLMRCSLLKKLDHQVRGARAVLRGGVAAVDPQEPQEVLFKGRSACRQQHTRTHGLLHTHAHTHVGTHTHTHAHTCAHAHTRTRARTRTHTHTHTCARAHTHARAHAHTHTHAHMRARTHTRAHARTHTHAHMRARTAARVPRGARVHGRPVPAAAGGG